MDVLSVRDLTVKFRSSAATVHAVTGVNLDLRPGEVMGIVGETGSGKSTVVRSIIGLLPPAADVTDGVIRFDGSDTLAMSKQRLRSIRGARIGFVPQNPFGALNPTLSIEKQFRKIIAAHRSSSRQETRVLAVEMLRRVGIHDADRVLSGYAHQLSGGMAQRVVIAMALALGPVLILADEPTTGLDVTIQRQILELVVDLSKQGERSTLLVTHDIGVVAQFCDRVTVMYAGQMVEVGSVDRVLTSPAHPYTRALLASVPRRGHKLQRLSGNLPNLRVEPPEQCVFYDRCPVRSDPRCATERPALRDVGEQHQVAAFCSEMAG